MKSRAWLGLILFLAFWALAPLPAAAQAAPPDASILSLDRIFGSREFGAERFGPARWMSGGEAYTTLEPSPTIPGGRDLVVYRAANGERAVLVAAEKLVPPGAGAPLAIEDYGWSPDGRVLIVFTASRRVWRQNTRGDFWTYELESGRLRRLGRDFAPSSLMFAKLSPDGTRAAYVVDNDIYVERLAGGEILRLTFDGGPETINGTSDWVNEEEFGIRDGFRWSPDGTAIAFWRFETSGVPLFSMIDNTSDLYPRLTRFPYPKAGQRNSAVRIGIVHVAGGYPTWIQAPGDPRESYIPRLDWAGNSRQIVFQHLNRLQNTNTVMLADAATGQVRTVFVDRDETWVETMDDFLWLGGGKELLWISEKDGWRHVYAAPRQGGEARLLTPDAYDIVSLDAVDEATGWLYFTASPEDATGRFLFRARLDGRGRPERLGSASARGVHRYDFSPSSRWAFHSFSRLDEPPVTELVRLPGGESVRILAGNAALKAKVEALKRRRAEFLKIDIGGGVQVDAWRILPPDFDPARKYPLLVYVYGEPAGQTVQDAWGGSGYLWHLMLAQKGFIVASFDNRGTPAPRGRAWRKSIYRQIGILASADQAAAARAAIASWPFVDPDRIGVWGWSGGGSMTLNALFRYPELYKAGIAVASVPDQRYYDSIYQERYMGLPADNPDGFRDGSPIAFAKQLRGKLLLVHGTGDDNVHYQGFEALVDALVAAGKPFRMLSYPNRSHGIFEGRGTTLHLYNAFTDFLCEALPPGPR